MCHRRTLHALLAVAFLLALAPLPALAAPPAQGDCAGNLLRNAGFEEGFSTRGAGEVEVANGWDPWWMNGSPEETADGFLRRPEYKPENAHIFGTRRVRSGVFSQKWFTTFSTHNGGIFQRVSVPSGSQATFSIWVQVWSSTDPNPDAVVEPGHYRVSIGIDPTGATNGGAGSVVWSEEVVQYNTWVKLTVQAKAQADAITVFLRGRPEYRTQFNDSYWDDACLTIVRPTARPTNTPRATNTPLPTNTPTPTNTPEPTDTPTPTATPMVGSISLLAYQDANGNGLRDPNEGLVPGVEFTLQTTGGAKVDQYTTDGKSEPKLYDQMNPGDYTITGLFPSGYVPTGPMAWSISLGAGAAFNLEFGAKFAPTPTATRTVIPTRTPTPTPVPEPNTGGSLGSALYQIVGLLTLALALGLGIGLYLRRRSRTP